MLAEKRVKTKWTLNPRGALWSKDDSKKGQQLLQKMGWSKGEGLGKNKTGVVDPLTLRANRGNRGLGMNSSSASDWTEHHESFEALLANLNSGSDSTQPKPPKKLEEKSKSSKTRVHYHKFSRGKDLTNYSEQDLSQIFGAPGFKKRRKLVEACVDVQGLSKLQNIQSSENVETEHGVRVIQGGTLNDYFNRKMGKKKTNQNKEAVAAGKDVAVSGKTGKKVADEDPGPSSSAEPQPETSDVGRTRPKRGEPTKRAADPVVEDTGRPKRFNRNKDNECAAEQHLDSVPVQKKKGKKTAESEEEPENPPKPVEKKPPRKGKQKTVDDGAIAEAASDEMKKKLTTIAEEEELAEEATNATGARKIKVPGKKGKRGAPSKKRTEQEPVEEHLVREQDEVRDDAEKPEMKAKRGAGKQKAVPREGPEKEFEDLGMEQETKEVVKATERPGRKAKQDTIAKKAKDIAGEASVEKESGQVAVTRAKRGKKEILSIDEGELASATGGGTEVAIPKTRGTDSESALSLEEADSTDVPIVEDIRDLIRLKKGKKGLGDTKPGDAKMLKKKNADSGACNIADLPNDKGKGPGKKGDKDKGPGKKGKEEGPDAKTLPDVSDTTTETTEGGAAGRKTYVVGKFVSGNDIEEVSNGDGVSDDLECGTETVEADPKIRKGKKAAAENFPPSVNIDNLPGYKGY